MAATSTNEDKTSLKVLVHKEKNKVIYAEADGKFVDTLFSIMALPIGTIVRILEKCSDQRLKSLESLQNLYQSLVELPAGYFSTEESKFMMLNSKTTIQDWFKILKCNIDDTDRTKFFVCENKDCYDRASGSYFSTSNIARCSFCEKLMTREIACQDKDICHVIEEDEKNGDLFVSNLTTFIITDDLRVIPSTLDMSLELLSDLGFTDASHVEEMTIDIGYEQMLILVKAALLLKYPLTYLVFHSIHPITSGGLVNPKLGTSIQHLTSNGNDRNSKTWTLRVTFQKSTSKFLFAEAEEDFVEFLFGFLEIPLGTLIWKLMDGDSSLGCLDNVYASMCNMKLGNRDMLYSMLLEPKLEWKYVSVNQIFPLDVSKDSESIYHLSFFNGIGTLKDSSQIIDGVTRLRFKDPRVAGRFLKGPMKFMLTDDLILKVPLKDVEHHEVSIGIEKGLQLLNASLNSNSSLTDVLLEEIIKKKKGLAVNLYTYPRVGEAGGAKRKSMSDAEKAAHVAYAEKRKRREEEANPFDADAHEKMMADEHAAFLDDIRSNNLLERMVLRSIDYEESMTKLRSRKFNT